MKLKHEEETIRSENLFPVVGVGASAGGLDAFKKFIRAIPEKSGMAYVLVQHLDPTHESILTELLQKVTTIPVLEIFDEIKVERDHIYIIPSNKMLLANDGVLEIRPRPSKIISRKNLPIDLFFYSLAEVHQAQAIGVVLSGTASDGTQGLKAIKDQGGITFAQDEASAAYPEMPRNAILANVVDFILPPEEIPKKIQEITMHDAKHGLAENDILRDNDVFKQIISLLHLRTGTDFSYYKQTTIRRRILRRMVLNKNEALSSYLKQLRDNKSEQDILYHDLLIPVTRFFRDPNTFSYLCASIFPVILKDRDTSQAIRIWIAACSTGEEAYSMAMCLQEYLDDNLILNNAGDDYKVQIFATDISEPAINKARVGIYSRSELEGISPERLERFFIPGNGGYRVNKRLREMCVFARHNFLKDPPFGKMDLISCRNVLIYLEPYLQKKALSTFHYALIAEGFLLLGKSETTSGVPELFKVTDKTEKLFTRKDVPGKFVVTATDRIEQTLRDTNTVKAGKLRTDFQKTADDILLAKYTPGGVVVNEAMDIVHFRGKTGAYLEQSPGKPSHNLLKMAKGALSFELRNILLKAKKDNETVIKENIPVEINGIQHLISIEAIPLPNVVEHHYLVLFHDAATLTSENNIVTGDPLKKRKHKSGANAKASTLRIQHLEKELTQIREDMRAITQEQEAANEELQSANEELLSSSEELQSVNEELETSKEELQATIEELTTVNQEMIALTDQVAAARDYAEGIVATVRESLLVLDADLNVKSANRSFYKTFQVSSIETEGKSIYDIGNGQWNQRSLHEVLEKIIPDKATLVDIEVSHNFPHIGQRTTLLNAREITGADSTESLILLAIEDITDRALSRLKEQRLLDELKQSESHFRLLADLLPAKISNAKGDGEVIYFSEAWLDFAGMSFEELRDFGYHKIMHPDEIEEFQRLLLHAAKTGTVMEMEMRFKNTMGEYIWHLNRASPVMDEDGNIKMWVGVTTDISDQIKTRENNLEHYTIHSKELEEKVRYRTIELVNSNETLEERNEELLRTNQELNSFTYVSSHDLQEPLRKIQTFINILLQDENEHLSDNGREQFKRIRRSAERMQSLLKDLLAFARISIVDRVFERVELNDILQEVVSDLKEEIEEKNATVEIKQLCSMYIIPFQFRQLMVNLIGNSLKFSKNETAPHIIIESVNIIASKLNPHHLKSSSEYCHIHIKDNGIGFDPQYSDKIFELFQRLHSKSAYEGTGMGLFIVKKIVDNHNGQIFASSEVGLGATFDIYIPTEKKT